MKKKLLSAIILSALVLSLAGCGNESTPDEPTSAESQNAAADDSTAEETTAPPETTEVTTETEAPKEIAKVTSCDKFGNGDMLISDGDKNYVYSITDNKMYSGDDEIFDNIIAVGGKLALVRGDDDDENYYYNLEAEEKYDVNPLYHNTDIDEYNAVYKIDESFDGNVNYVGVINSDGEWVLPLSSDYAICQNDPRDISSPVKPCCTGSLMWFDGSSVYDYKNDKIISSDRTEISFFGIDVIVGDKILGMNLDGYLSEYNTQTEQVSIISKDFRDDYSMELWYNYRGALATSDSKSSLIWDNDGNLIDCDLSDYDYSEAIMLLDIADKYIIFQTKNIDGDIYIIVTDKKGNRVIEPIRGVAHAAYIYNDYAVITGMTDGNDAECQYIVNCTTGETTAYTGTDNFNFDPKSGKLIIKKDGNYYIADVSDPETLLNPFELADE